MLRNYLLLTWRNGTKHAAPSLINLVGLAMGVACCVLIFFYVRFQTTYDAYNSHSDRIERVTVTIKNPGPDVVMAHSPMILARYLKNEFPEVEAAARFTSTKTIVRSQGVLFKEENFYESDPSVFSVFTFHFLEGSPSSSLSEPNSILLSRSMAKKYFGNLPALGRSLVCNGQVYKVSGVYADRPANSDLKVDALLSKDISGITDFMDDFATYTFVLLRQDSNPATFAAHLRSFSSKQVQPQLDKIGAASYHLIFNVEPLRDVHYSQGKPDDTPKGNRSTNTLFSFLAVFILLIALLNYVNLSTAKAGERAREVGIRKVNGAGRASLIRQFLLESFVLVTIAWSMALGLVWLSLPFFNALMQTTLSVDLGSGNGIWLGLAWLTTALLAGAYPAFILSSFEPSKVLKGSWKHSSSGLFLRRFITVVQFTITTGLITGAIVLYGQMHFQMHKDRGFATEGIIQLHTPEGPENKDRNATFLEALKGQAGVESVTGGSGVGAGSMATTFAYRNGQKEEFMCNYMMIDPAFLPLMKMHLQSGRNFSEAMATDKTGGFLVNEALVRKMQWTAPIGQERQGFDHQGKVIGVVQDFYYESLHNMVAPLAIIYETQTISAIEIRAKPEDLPNIKKVWAGFYPNLPFDPTFLSDEFRHQYDQDQITMRLFDAFTLLAIFISCLGLYGLISITVAYRTKEIGVRKILGASLPTLVTLLLRDSVRLILLAACIALPLAGLGVHRWLSASYAYHISPSWWMYVLPVGVILALTLFVTGFQVLRAAQANPAQSLRTE